MKFRLVRRGEVALSASPYRLVNEAGSEVEWANRFLDRQRVMGAILSLPELALLRGDPRLKALRKKVGLPE